MYKIAVFIPEADLESVKTAMFAAGAGKIGNYDSCCWQVRGEGQFRPLENSQPHIGSHYSLEKVVEYKVEMVCEDELIAIVLKAMISAHPYEEPAYDVIQLVDIPLDKGPLINMPL